MSDNLTKSAHGYSGIKNLKDLLRDLKEIGFIKDYIETFRTGYEKYNSNQFHFQFLVIHNNNEKWIVQSTTSIRTDRINIQQWNSYHIKKIKDEITKAIIIYPDDLNPKEKENALNYSNKIKNKEIYSAIDLVMSQSKFINLVEEKFLEESKSGYKTAIKGLKFEELIVNLLNSQENFKKWKTGDGNIVGLFFPYFVKIFNKIGLKNTDDIKSVYATKNIPSLPSGGSPKTDILLKVQYSSGEIKNFTFSCKRSDKDWVTVHEYSVEKFINVLNISDSYLIKCLHSFQKVGGIRSLNSKMREYLNVKLPEYNKKLVLWVYGGYGGEGDPNIQWADFLITYKNNEEFKVYTLDEYTTKMKTVKGQFNTPFKWTYPSGGKGKRVQLKGKIL